MTELKSIVREIDPDAFVILLPAHQVLGEGFRVSFLLSPLFLRDFRFAYFPSGKENP